MYSRVSKSVSRLLVLAVAVALVPAALAAQDAAKSKAPADAAASKWDIFAGYSYLAPKGTVQVLQPDGITVTDVDYKSANYGVIGSAAYFFNRYVGAQVEGDYHTGPNDGFYAGSAGLIARYPTADITPFIHGLVGGQWIGGPEHEPYNIGEVLTAGGGLDYATPLFGGKLAIRLFQADYQYMHDNFGPGVYGGRANINAARLSAGLVFHVGSIVPPPPVTLSCSASPASVFPGDPITLTATAANLNPKKTATYTWTGTGVTGSGPTATVATGSLSAGSYTVKGSVSEGTKPGESAECSASFTVKQFEPPTVSCSANPTTIKPGDTSMITATGISPQNRPLTYSYSASEGTVTGTGTSATFASAGVPAGAATITCSVADDKGQTASSTTTVTITAPYVAPAPKTSALCTIGFDKDKKNPTRVDNEAKACLDDIALTLQKQSDATAAIVGEATSAEKMPKKTKKHEKPAVDDAAQRAVNTKEYLVKEKGIDASRITVYTGTEDSKKVENYLVPSGATFESDVPGTTKVGDSVKPQVRKPLGAKKHSKKKPM